MELRRQALEDERRRREQLERRLQDETTRRQKLVEKEVKLREKHFSQVRGKLTPSGRVSCLPAWLVSQQGGSGCCRQTLRVCVAFLGSSPDTVPPHPQGRF